MKKLALYLAVAALAAACASKETKEGPAVTDRSSGVPSATAGGTSSTTTPTPPSQGMARNELTDPNSPLSKRSVYFDYDSNTVKDEYRGLVQAHSRYLADKRDAHIRIEGNCDERGSREYNLGLGQRRADALKKRLVLLGAQETQIESVSQGEEKLVCNETSEECYAKCRRDDMLYGGQF